MTHARMSWFIIKTDINMSPGKRVFSVNRDQWFDFKPMWTRSSTMLRPEAIEKKENLICFLGYRAHKHEWVVE